MGKKAQGLSMNVIIVAAVLLVVMIIVLVIFKGEIGKVPGKFDACEIKGGGCVESESDCDGKEIPEGECGDRGNYCCLKNPLSGDDG